MQQQASPGGEHEKQVPIVPTPAALPPKTFETKVFGHDNLPSLDTAAGLGDAFRSVYKDGYGCSAFTDPHVFLVEAMGKKVIPLITLDEGNKPVGHGAVIILNDRVAELGRLFIHPSAQGYGLTKPLLNAAMETVRRLHQNGEIDVAYTEGVTSHLVTQKMFHGAGFVPTGIFDRKYTDFFHAGYRESVIRFNLILNEGVKERREVYLPPNLSEIASTIYDASKCARVIRVRPYTPGSHQNPQDDVRVDRYEFGYFGAVTIDVDPGRQPHDITIDALNEFCRGAKHVSVRVDICHPDAIYQINALRTLGFYFAALEPHPSSDFLVMQRLAISEDKGVCPKIKSLYPQASERLLELMRKTQGLLKPPPVPPS